MAVVSKTSALEPLATEMDGSDRPSFSARPSVLQMTHCYRNDKCSRIWRGR